MPYLLTVSLIWAFSFGLIGSRLAGVDSAWVAAIRMAIALAVFLPFYRPRALSWENHLKLVGLGALQFGMMYLFLFSSFSYIPSHLVALFTILTPVYIHVLNDLAKRHLHARYLVAVLLSLAGAYIIRFQPTEASFDVLKGFLLVQGANLAFGSGQLYYRHWKLQNPLVSDYKIFTSVFLGAFGLSFFWAFVRSGWDPLFEVTASQWGALLYLGGIASGLGFWAWNRGATMVNPGTLATANNLVIPLGIIISLFIFGEIQNVPSEQLIRLGLGGVMIVGAVLFVRKFDYSRRPG